MSGVTSSMAELSCARLGAVGLRASKLDEGRALSQRGRRPGKIMSSRTSRNGSRLDKHAQLYHPFARFKEDDVL